MNIHTGSAGGDNNLWMCLKQKFTKKYHVKYSIYTCILYVEIKKEKIPDLSTRLGVEGEL